VTSLDCGGNEYELITSDSTKEILDKLNVDASLKASFLCGLVKVEGSAKFLKEEK
jgi:hypothetical protein